MSEVGKEKGQWHLDRTVSLAHILTTASLLLVLVAGLISLSTRLAVLESSQTGFNERIVILMENQSSTDDRQDGDIDDIEELIREDYHEIINKLDNLSRQIP